jgi:hypothetical protein
MPASAAKCRGRQRERSIDERVGRERRARSDEAKRTRQRDEPRSQRRSQRRGDRSADRSAARRARRRRLARTVALVRIAADEPLYSIRI